MCGRLTLTSGDYDAVARDLQAAVDDRVRAIALPRHNAAPTDTLAIVRRLDGQRRLVPAQWGFRVRRPEGESLVINARAESLLSRPTFRGPAEGAGRCIVPSDGFFEWSGPKGDRQPHWFHRPERAPLPFAGLCRVEDGVLRFVVLTLDADPFVARVHHRMPAMLRLDAIEGWLTGAPLRLPAPLEHWLDDHRPDDLAVHPVSRRVNGSGDDDPALLEPVQPPPSAPVQTSLFGE